MYVYTYTNIAGCGQCLGSLSSAHTHLQGPDPSRDTQITEDFTEEEEEEEEEERAKCKEGRRCLRTGLPWAQRKLCTRCTLRLVWFFTTI
jgi:hypothetical protein